MALHIDYNSGVTALFSMQYRALLRHLPETLKALVSLAYFSGMRRGELLSLRWEHVDLERRTITLRAEDTKTPGSHGPYCGRAARGTTSAKENERRS